MLVIGAVIGITLDRTVVRHAHMLHSGEAGEHGGLVASLHAELDLDEEQRHAIWAIIGHHQERVDHAWASVRPEVNAAVDSIELQIAEVLRPDQLERFHAWFRRHHPRE